MELSQFSLVKFMTINLMDSSELYMKMELSMKDMYSTTRKMVGGDS